MVVYQSPTITVKDSTNPNQCATPTGFINLNGLNNNTQYNIFYTIHSGVKMQTQTSDGSGVLKLDTLRAGTYSNIYVTLNGCPSKPVRTITLTDPTPPATPTITALDSICSGNNLSLSANTISGIATYQWNGPTGFNASGATVSINNISTSASGQYAVTATINNCTSAPALKNIRVDSTPIVPALSSNSPICTDSTINLFANTIYPETMTYYWSNANGYNSSNQNPTIPLSTISMAGFYNVYVVSPHSCISKSDSILVTINPSPNVDPVLDSTYKNGVPSGLILFTGNVAGTTFTWTNTNTNIGLAASGINSINFTTTNITPYAIVGLITVTPSTALCVGKPITFKIVVNPTPKLTSKLNDTICTSTIFSYQATSATAGVKYVWSRAVIAGITNPAQISTDSLGKIDEILINTTASPIDVIYTIKLVATDGSVNSQDITVTVNPNAKAEYIYTSDKLCTPGILDTNIIKIVEYPNANNNYQWYANSGPLSNGVLFPGFTIVNNGDSVNIQLIAISKFGCKDDTMQHQFYTVTKPVASFTKDIAKGCGPLTVSFTNTTTPLNEPSYKWLFGNGDSSTLQNPLPETFMADTSALRRDTTYYITLIALNQCDTIKFFDSVKVRPQPRALFQPSATVGCSIFHFNAVNNSLGMPSTYYWYWGDGNIDSSFNNAKVFHDYHTGVTDTFTLKLLNKNECGVDSFKVDIVVYPNVVFPKLIVNGQNTFACAPQNIQFINNSFGGNKYIIDFGDGSPVYITTKGLDTVYHLYNNGGIYTASIYGTNGCSDTTTSQTITIYQSPKANFSTTLNQYCKKETIPFKNLSDPTLSFEWKFGDGITSTALNPSHAYTSAGVYTVTFIAKSTNITGAVCTDTMRKVITIYDLPVALFTTNAAIQNCQTYTFNGYTQQPMGYVANWIFYDPFSSDTTQAGFVGIHNFKQPGNYNIKLIVFNKKGCSDTTTTTVKVIETPKASFTQSDSIVCVPGKQINFINTSTYAAPDAVNYQWYIDGILQSTSKHFSNNFSAATNITKAIVYQIKLVVINSFGCSDSTKSTVVIYPKAQPAFALNTTLGCTPLILQFYNSSQYANIFKWYVDGTLFSTNANPFPITLSNPASTYTIKLVVDHTLGCGADSLVKQVSTYTKPVAAFKVPNRSGCDGTLTIQFADLSSVVGANIKQWFWNFGDGHSDTVQNPKHTYTSFGAYNINLWVKDDRGCASNPSTQSVINFGKPNAKFLIGDACVNTVAIPVNLSTPGFGSKSITSYLWNFGDGTLVTGLQPTHIYSAEGTYKISLIITSDSSCVADTTYQNINIFGKPIADFKVANNCVNVNTLFTNTSFAGYAQTAIGNSKWTFGDGGFGTNFNALHTYLNTGNFNVTLAVSGNKCPSLMDTITKTITVVKAREAVTYPRLDGVRGTPILLAALSGGISYNWQPATGLSNNNIQNPIANYVIADPSKILYSIAITDSFGCTVKDKQEVWLFATANIFLPTAFTPNGDGANDLFKPTYINITKLEFFRVFDRWGKIIFETSDMGKSWDGTYNGKQLPTDTYCWIIAAVNDKATTISQKGNVTLIRD
jgi:gliding motility-associated-like protein